MRLSKGIEALGLLGAGQFRLESQPVKGRLACDLKTLYVLKYTDTGA
jgi:hypothetical protein